MTKDKALAMAGKTTWASHSREQVDAALSVLATSVRELEAENERLKTNPEEALRRLARSLSYCDDCEAPACDDAKPEGPRVLCHDCAIKHKATTARHEQDIEAAYYRGYHDGACDPDIDVLCKAMDEKGGSE